MQKKIMLLGSGELGKEVVIALQRLGQYVIAVDSYQQPPPGVVFLYWLGQPVVGVKPVPDRLGVVVAAGLEL